MYSSTNIYLSQKNHSTNLQTVRASVATTRWWGDSSVEGTLKRTNLKRSLVMVTSCHYQGQGHWTCTVRFHVWKGACRGLHSEVQSIMDNSEMGTPLWTETTDNITFPNSVAGAKIYMWCTLIWLNGTCTTHSGFSILGRFSGTMAYVLVNWAFAAATQK